LRILFWVWVCLRAAYIGYRPSFRAAFPLCAGRCSDLFDRFDRFDALDPRPSRSVYIWSLSLVGTFTSPTRFFNITTPSSVAYQLTHFHRAHSLIIGGASISTIKSLRRAISGCDKASDRDQPFIRKARLCDKAVISKVNTNTPQHNTATRHNSELDSSPL
jgi:hypothetical protein